MIITSDILDRLIRRAGPVLGDNPDFVIEVAKIRTYRTTTSNTTFWVRVKTTVLHVGKTPPQKSPHLLFPALSLVSSFEKSTLPEVKPHPPVHQTN